jgi:hypothetical protein
MMQIFVDLHVLQLPHLLVCSVQWRFLGQTIPDHLQEAGELRINSWSGIAWKS